MSIRDEAGDDPSPYHDHGTYGDTRKNLNEIRRRLGWLARDGYN